MTPTAHPRPDRAAPAPGVPGTYRAEKRGLVRRPLRLAGGLTIGSLGAGLILVGSLFLHHASPPRNPPPVSSVLLLLLCGSCLSLLGLDLLMSKSWEGSK